jgi:very-short-patch-repair endonuclease
MSWTDVFDTLGLQIASRAQLVSAGASGHSLTAAVRFQHLLRVRRDHYALPSTPAQTLQAVRVGGRLGCVSALLDMGVFAIDGGFPHLHLDPELSRARSPRRRSEQLTADNRDGATLHWLPLADPGAATECRVGIVDSLAQAVRCQHPWHAIGSLDNALFLGLIDEAQLRAVFAKLPRRLQYLRPLVDGRAESGQESVLRSIVREAGLSFEIQVRFPTVGRVDMVVEKRLVIEADSRLAHEGWDKQVRDRTRDLELARLSLMSLRPLYTHIMHEPQRVREAIVTLLALGA